TKSRPQIKWPNDILINGKKSAGILTEMQAEQDQIQYVVMGIGLNVNQTNDDFPKELEKTATSLKKETNRTWDIVALIQEILTTFENTYDAYIQKGFPYIKDKWEKYGFKIGNKSELKHYRMNGKQHFQVLLKTVHYYRKQQMVKQRNYIPQKLIGLTKGAIIMLNRIDLEKMKQTNEKISMITA